MAVKTEKGKLYAIRVGSRWHRVTGIAHGIATIFCGCGEGFGYNDVWQSFYDHSEPETIRQEHKFCECAYEEICDVYADGIVKWDV